MIDKIHINIMYLDDYCQEFSSKLSTSIMKIVENLNDQNLKKNF